MAINFRAKSSLLIQKSPSSSTLGCNTYTHTHTIGPPKGIRERGIYPWNVDFWLFPKSIPSKILIRSNFHELSSSPSNSPQNSAYFDIWRGPYLIRESIFEAIFEGINGDAFSMSGWKKSKKNVSFLSRDHRVLMFRSSLIHWQSLGESSAFARAKLFSVEKSYFSAAEKLAF